MLARLKTLDGFIGYRDVPDGADKCEYVLGTTGYPIHSELITRCYVYDEFGWDEIHACIMPCFREYIPQIIP